jgi:hypothetical protein
MPMRYHALTLFALSATLTLPNVAQAAPLPLDKAALSKPVPIASYRLVAKNKPTYTIRDFGAPPTATYSSSSIVAFNDSDEVVGTGLHGKVVDCVLYTGKAFISLTTSPSVTKCTPLAMNDENPKTGIASVVGYVNYAFANGTVAFDGSASTKELVNMELFSSNVPSELNAINDAGQAVGSIYYEPPGGFTGQPVAYTKAGSGLTLAEPTCVHRLKTCAQGLVFETCSFAGCDLDDRGDVEVVQIFSGSVNDEIFNITKNTCCSTSDEYLATSNHYISDYGDTEGVMIDFDYFDLIVNGADLGQPNQNEELQGCYSNPASFSNKGNILVVSTCYPGHADWTWDPANGFVDIADSLPANAYAKILPLGINDNGEILVELEPHSGPIHWGVLEPPASAKAALKSGVRRATARFRAPRV